MCRSFQCAGRSSSVITVTEGIFMNSIDRTWPALVIALLSSNLLAESPDPRCDVRGTNGVCPPPKTISWLKDCPRDDGGGHCGSPTEPVIADLVCVSQLGGIWCEAWPQAEGDRYSYSWSVSSGLPSLTTTDAHSPFAAAECEHGRGTVTVTVTAQNTQPGAAVAMVRCPEIRDSSEPL
jgi:hypothetical protein